MSVTNSVSLRRFLVFLSQCVCCALTVHLHKSSDPEVLHNTQPSTQIHTQTHTLRAGHCYCSFTWHDIYSGSVPIRETITADRLPKSCSITKTAIIINDIWKYDYLLHIYGNKHQLGLHVRKLFSIANFILLAIKYSTIFKR